VLLHSVSRYTADPLDIGPLISYEATFSDLARREARLGAGLLVYQSSTSSFQGSWAQSQLAGQPAVHAVEVGRPAVHAGLSGDSSAFDLHGRRLAWCPSGFRGAIVVSVPLGSNATLYQQLGDWVPVTAFVLLGGGVGFALFRWHRFARSDTLRG
jgi:apolipoprotein N-acyltransferase